MLRRSSFLAALAIASACASTASAQHANFVLFGQPTEGVKDIDPSNRFVHPVTAPYFHENSFVTSDVRAWAAYHSFDSDVGIDNAKVYAVQLRLAITNQVQFVAYKDGYTDLSSGLEDGWNDVAVGVKWNFLQDWGNNLHAAVGAGYELPWGNGDLDGDDEYRFWLSVDKGFDKLHIGGTVNVRLGNDDTPFVQTGPNTFSPVPLEGDSDMLSVHLHADYYLNKFVSPVVELNYYQPFSSNDGDGFINAGDVGNFATDQDSLTLGLGAEFRPIDNLGLRAAYELPLLDDNDLFGWRVTLSAVYGF